MDELTSSRINIFLERLLKEIQSHKEHATIEFGKWSLTGYKVSLEIFLNQEKHKVYFDLREVKENPTHLQHIVENVMDQIRELIKKNKED